MALRIGCDLDGTLADMGAALQREAETLFGADVDLSVGIGVPPEPPVELEVPDDMSGPPVAAPAAPPSRGPARRGLTSREYRVLWGHVQKIHNFWGTLHEIEPGSVARLARAVEQHEWEVIFLTQRPASAGQTAQVQTQRWLVSHGFDLPSVFVVSGSRGSIAAALNLDAVIDDRPENCLDVATDSEATPFLVWRESPQAAPRGAARLRIATVFSFVEALDRLEAMSAAKAAAASGVVGRIRQALGI